MKKQLILVFSATCLFISGVYIYKHFTKEDNSLEILKKERTLPEHSVRKLELWKDLNKKNPEQNPLVYNSSNHEGVAAFVGPFRVEVVLRDDRLIGVYIDNQKNLATLPKGTKMEIEFPESKEKSSLSLFDNGLLVGRKKTPPVFPLKFVLSGTLGEKPFAFKETLQKPREKEIIKKGKRND